VPTPSGSLSELLSSSCFSDGTNALRSATDFDLVIATLPMFRNDETVAVAWQVRSSVLRGIQFRQSILDRDDGFGAVSVLTVLLKSEGHRILRNSDSEPWEAVS
jgi:hypothetical protein